MKTVKPRLVAGWILIIPLSAIVLLMSGGCEYIIPNKPPYVKKISPADSAIFNTGQVINFEVNAYDVDGSVVRVVFTPPNLPAFTDETEPYEYAWPTAGMTEGKYSVEIKAIDNKDEPYIISAPVRLIGTMTANAGKDTTFTDSRTSCVLDAETPVYAQGTWSIISGTDGRVSDIHDPKSNFTGIHCQVYTLRWTVSNGVTQVSDEVTIGFSYQPSKALAGPDQLIIDGSLTAVLQAVTPSDGIGSWRILSGGAGTFNNASLPNAIFTGLACKTYSLIWSVSTPCAVSSDTIQISYDQFLVDPHAGPDQVYTDGRKSTTLAANAPPMGAGTWSVIAGQNGQFTSSNDPKAIFSGQLCQTYILRWTLSSPCTSKSDDVTIIFNHTATQANAGPDLTVNGPGRSVILDANTPVQGTGMWSVSSGPGGIFEDARNPNSRFTGEPCQSYTLKWTISTLCENSSDQMNVAFTDHPSIADAGPDQHLTDGSISTHLNATPPVSGTGLWSIVSGGSGSFSDVSDPHALFTGILCRSYVLRWTVSTACNNSFDEVTIVLNQVALNPDAGPDIRISDGTLTTVLQGNSPLAGTLGTWSIESGQGGSLENVNSPVSRFTGVSGQIYILKWLFSSTCLETYDLVTIAFISTSDMVDPRDAKTYKTIQVGNQVWMAENLAYTVPASFFYENRSENGTIYGRLYDWTTAGSVCPAGWHLPSDPEWRQLEIYLGMDGSTSLLEWYRGLNEGGMLKEEGTLYWEFPNTGASNITGFTARPGGYRTPGGVYGGVNTHAGFWTSTGNVSGKAIYRTLQKDRSQIGRDWYDKGYGFSIRCIKN